jgi:MFS family permease
MPLYLKSIGFTMIGIGILEGIAEALVGLSKGFFGKWSDMLGKRVPFVRWGYGLSAVSKPLMVAFSYPLWIFFMRILDRLGKGIRTSPRDALLSQEATPNTKAQIFGFHRSMDTLGAVLGPLLALAFLYFFPLNYQLLFLIAFIPGFFALVATFLLREKNSIQQNENSTQPSFLSFLNYWKSSTSNYKRLVSGFLFFALFNSSDTFLLLQLKKLGYDDLLVITVYIFYNLVYALFAYPFGILADKIGIKKIFLLGLLGFIMVYIGMAFNSNLYVFFLLFFVYGLYAAVTEGISKAWITKTCLLKDTATALGFFTALQSISFLLANLFTGLLAELFHLEIAFMITACSVSFVSIYFIFKVPSTYDVHGNHQK